MSEYALMTEEQKDLKKMVRDILTKELAPIVKEYDIKGEFPMQVYHKLGEVGLYGMDIPEEYGGPGFDAATIFLLREEFGKIDVGFSVSYGAATVGFKIMNAGGSEEQKRKVAKQIVEDGIITAMCITEPQGGSDVANTKTRAIKEGNEYVINGTKTFITNGGIAGVYIVVAATDPEKGSKGLSCFIVDRDTPGVSVGKEEDKMGIRLSNTTDVVFENVRIPAENLIGKEGEGFKYTMMALEKSRATMGGTLCGLMQEALEQSVAYAKERVVFGKPIAKQQAVQHMLAEMEMAVETSRSIGMYACSLIDNGLPLGTIGSVSKAYITEAAIKVVNDAMQVFGGYGYSREYPIEKMVRDARIYTIFEGTNQIQRNIIAGNLIRR